MLRAGRKKFETDALMPRRTLRSLQRDASFIQREAAAKTERPATLRAQREEVH
jgi:hypothetical protein